FIIDLRESIMDFPNQPVVTRDNVEIAVHPMLLYRLVDPVRVAYETYDLSHAVEKLVQTTLRSIIGEMGLDDTLSSREEIERSLKSKIAHVCYDWGLEIRSVELLEITPNTTVQDAMHRQLSAERMRRAAIVSADGQREKTKLEAEGECQSRIALATGEKQVAIIRAQGQADARRLIAKAEADAVRIIAAALHEYGIDATQYHIGMKYIDMLANLAMTASSRQVYFPLQTDVAGALSVVSSGLEAVRKLDSTGSAVVAR
ncbi:SPFH/Band 7/PHB domain protein, partial [archaeon]